MLLLGVWILVPLRERQTRLDQLQQNDGHTTAVALVTEVARKQKRS